MLFPVQNYASTGLLTGEEKNKQRIISRVLIFWGWDLKFSLYKLALHCEWPCLLPFFFAK
jgi:hypothetical protein